MTKIDKPTMEDKGIKEDYPSCYTNYCKNDEACFNCPYKEECRTIKKPKDPGWCQ
ncbi:MAG: hypothetical protein ACFFAS_04300 [Promethearchaeota archaeon]